MVKSSELQEVVAERAQQNPRFGRKLGKGVWKGKGNQVAPKVDASTLRLEEGIFCMTDDKPVGQLDLSQVGPSPENW